MFFYNQRALFFISGGIFLGILTPFALSGTPYLIATHVKTLELLWGTWSFALLATLGLHKSFTERLSAKIVEPSSSSFPRLFYPYFILDSISVLGLIALSRWYYLDLHFYALLLFANLVVYSACVATWKGTGPAHLPLPIALWFVCMIVFVHSDLEATHQDTIFHRLVDLGPQFGTTFVTIMAVLMISWLRHGEHYVTQQQLDFLGSAEDLLSSPLATEAVSRDEQTQAPMEREFQARIRALLKALCSLGSPFWYSSGCFWFIEGHQDRGNVLVPGPSYKLSGSLAAPSDIALPVSFGTAPRILCGATSIVPDVEVPECFVLPTGPTDISAMIPIIRGRRECGVLTLHGNGSPAGARVTELVFLKTLGRIVADVMEQWDNRGRIAPQEDIDELFRYDSLIEVLEKSTYIIRRHLYSSCCAIVFRPRPNDTTIKVEAALGFKGDVKGAKFSSESHPIGTCATSGLTVKCDDFASHRENFSDRGFRALEEQHRSSFHSWMLIPIGQKGRNFGVVIVANRRLKCPWFTEEDRLLAETLTFRLQALVEKFLHIEKIEEAQKRAETEATEADVARRIAESAARQRQDDLMVMTHQLQAPLYSVKFGLEVLIMEKQADLIQQRLAYIEETIEDSLALCYGTVTTFAQAAGRKASFGASEIDAPEELGKLCRRLQRTNYREDLQLEFKSDRSFPKLKIDRNVFTSVLYSLIQNAMKYASKNSYVTLECSFERSSEEAALKVKSFGEPIMPQESDKIFERYQRGAVVTKTGRYHAGVGLGLWVARELMLAIGGNLTLELNSEHPRLSVFVVHCPPKAFM